jgi:antitoxin component YwqK of YwqJK toxin-antitoxin module
LKVYANIKNGNAIGESKLYHENGKLHMIIKWNGEDAEIVEIHDENGNLIKSTED